MSLKDPEARKKYHDAYSRNWYKRRAEQHQALQHETREQRRKRNLDFIWEQKTKPCTDCGNTFPPYAMHFDHLPGSIKVAGVAGMRSWGLAKIEAEIAKCELVCANCHAIRTYTRLHSSMDSEQSASIR